MSHETCQHSAYHLTCEDYDRLVEHAGGVCQTCGTAPEATRHGFLVIDHDSRLGQWAVRGLLCHNCNINLPRGTKPEWAQAYLEQPWWYVDAVARGIKVEVPDEPPIGSRVQGESGLTLVRTKRGWEHVANYRGAPRSWAEVLRRFGPHRIKIVPVGMNASLLTQTEES